MSSKRSTVFCALETYSLIGGLQNFNRRVIQHLGALSLKGCVSPSEVILMRDKPIDCPNIPGVKINAAGQYRLRFLVSTINALRSADLLILGHINLLPLVVAARLLNSKLPILLFVHGDEVWNDPKHRRMRWYETRFLRSVTLIASVSKFTAAKMADAFRVSNTKFRLLPNAIDRIPVPTERERIGLLILTVTRLGLGDREKNVDKVIAAVASLSKEMPDIRYEIVGDGELKPELIALARRFGISEQVRFLGRVDEQALRLAYERANVFVLPSSKEGFGIVYLEAWQHGLPVICSSEGASSEIISDGEDGFAVDPEDIDQLVGRLKSLLSQPDLARTFGARGQMKVEKYYTDEAFRARLGLILSELKNVTP